MQKSATTLYLQCTPLLDFDTLAIQHLIHQRAWRNLPSVSDQIAGVYHFVKDEILYASRPDAQLPASTVLKQGSAGNLGKTILLMALLRSLAIPCSLQADMVDKVVHRGLLGPLAFNLSPATLYHNEVQLLYNNRWLSVEGYTVDHSYLSKLQAMFPNYSGSFYGYGIAVLNFRNPQTKWEEASTSIQGKAVVRQLGMFNDPDAFYEAYSQALMRTQSLFYRKLLMPSLNKRIAALRGTGGCLEQRLKRVSDLKRG